jgi:Xaa-Pro aminopeptidase
MISVQEYQQRRQRLALQLPNNSIAIIPAARECLRNGDAHYRFRQDSDFYYLTGFNEPDAVLLITAGEFSESILFNRPRNKAEEQWTGRRLGQDDAGAQLGIQAAHPIAGFDTQLPQLLSDRRAIYYPISRYPDYDKRILSAWEHVKNQVRRGTDAPAAFYDIAPLMGEMRLFKSIAEMQCMREAARISVAAHTRAMQRCSQLRFEYEVEAEILHELVRQGCRDLAYDSIVAGGNNAAVLHYTNNNQALRAGELLLIDAGGEYQNYAADITRSFPINGRYSPEQKAIYALVLAAQKAGIQQVKPGCIWADIQQTIVRVLTTGLLDLGLLKGALDDLITNGAYKPFYMHQSGHWLGLDVHDVGRYKVNGDWRALEAGMVLTVEPGIYIHAGMENVDSRWHGIGVRIEDDIHVTADGYENLSAQLPVEVDDIEALIRG